MSCEKAQSTDLLRTVLISGSAVVVSFSWVILAFFPDYPHDGQIIYGVLALATQLALLVWIHDGIAALRLIAMPAVFWFGVYSVTEAVFGLFSYEPTYWILIPGWLAALTCSVFGWLGRHGHVRRWQVGTWLVLAALFSVALAIAPGSVNLGD